MTGMVFQQFNLFPHLTCALRDVTLCLPKVDEAAFEGCKRDRRERLVAVVLSDAAVNH